jgi:hypothetical protein
VFVVVLPALFIAVAFIRFSMALLRSLLGERSRPRRQSATEDYLSDVLAHLTANRIGSAGQTPITFARIRDSDGQIVPVRIEGHFASGAITPGDAVTFRFRIVDGVYIATDGENHTTRDAIRLRR